MRFPSIFHQAGKQASKADLCGGYTQNASVVVLSSFHSGVVLLYVRVRIGVWDHDGFGDWD